MEALRANQLTIGFPPDRVLSQNMSMGINTGQLVGLVGQNGVGKSTFIRTICGLQKPMEGEILIGNHPIKDLSPSAMSKKLSVVLTGKPDSLNLTVLELVALGRHPYSGWLGNLRSDDKRAIEEAISRMEINYLAEKRLYELSDGQLQKVMIARALAQDTEVIILDEPTSHLDLKNKLEVLQLLKEIATSGKAVLISTHEIDLSKTVCDEFWCMDFGAELLVGKPRELIKSGKLQEYLHVPRETLA